MTEATPTSLRARLAEIVAANAQRLATINSRQQAGETISDEDDTWRDTVANYATEQLVIDGLAESTDHAKYIESLDGELLVAFKRLSAPGPLPADISPAPSSPLKTSAGQEPFNDDPMLPISSDSLIRIPPGERPFEDDPFGLDAVIDHFIIAKALIHTAPKWWTPFYLIVPKLNIKRSGSKKKQGQKRKKGGNDSKEHMLAYLTGAYWVRGFDVKWDPSDSELDDHEVSSDLVSIIDLESDYENDINVAHSKMLFTSGFVLAWAGACGNIAYLNQVTGVEMYHASFVERLQALIGKHDLPKEQQLTIGLRRESSVPAPLVLSGLGIQEPLYVVASALWQNITETNKVWVVYYLLFDREQGDGQLVAKWKSSDDSETPARLRHRFTNEAINLQPSLPMKPTSVRDGDSLFARFLDHPKVFDDTIRHMYIELLKAQILDHNAAMLMIEARIVNWLPDELKKSTPTKLHKPLPSSSSSEDSSPEPEAGPSSAPKSEAKAKASHAGEKLSLVYDFGDMREEHAKIKVDIGDFHSLRLPGPSCSDCVKCKKPCLVAPNLVKYSDNEPHIIFAGACRGCAVAKSICDIPERIDLREHEVQGIAADGL